MCAVIRFSSFLKVGCPAKSVLYKGGGAYSNKIRRNTTYSLGLKALFFPLLKFSGQQYIVLVFQLLSEGFLLLGETLLLELEFGLAFDGEFVVRDTRAELADAVI
ncbi:Uncharacterised protein [Porphyromonas macacae]|uniref:Uncharacterized protein n=1 Tax=Porphyromonas macacae TaxID=28115 RepID=A0A379DJS6_9PORP|nr:Uncharacterised protein [Porphyromonas macacae]